MKHKFLEQYSLWTEWKTKTTALKGRMCGVCGFSDVTTGERLNAQGGLHLSRRRRQWDWVCEAERTASRTINCNKGNFKPTSVRRIREEMLHLVISFIWLKTSLERLHTHIPYSCHTVPYLITCSETFSPNMWNKYYRMLIRWIEWQKNLTISLDSVVLVNKIRLSNMS